MSALTVTHPRRCSLPQKLTHITQRMFSEVYDATQSFRSKGLMQRIGLSELLRGDVVVAEFYCIRSPELTGRRVVAPATWRVWFELSAVSLLVRAPRLPFPYVPDDFNGCL